MAEKVGGEKSTRKQTREAPGKGHNIDKLRKDGEGIVKAYLAKKEAMESDMAGYRSEINEIYEKGAEKLGIKKSVLSAELKRIEKAKKQEAKESGMAPDEREQTELFRSSMEGTPFGDWAAGELAEAAAPG